MAGALVTDTYQKLAQNLKLIVEMSFFIIIAVVSLI